MKIFSVQPIERVLIFYLSKPYMKKKFKHVVILYEEMLPGALGQYEGSDGGRLSYGYNVWDIMYELCMLLKKPWWLDVLKKKGLKSSYRGKN